MSYYNPGGNPQGGYPQSASGRQKKQKINEVVLEGEVKPRSSNENEPIKFYPFPNGGGAVHINLKVVEVSDKIGQDGQPRQSTVYVPVDVSTNKIIDENLLRNLAPGSRVRVTGKLELNSYTSKDGKKVSNLVVRAFVLQLISLPAMQNAAYGAPAGGYPMPGMQPQQGMQMNQPFPQYAQPYGQPMPPAQPAGQPYGQPAAPAQTQGVPPYYQPAGQPMPPAQPAGQPYGQPAAPAQAQGVPPYYQPAGQQAPQYPPIPPQAQNNQSMDIRDLGELPDTF